MATVMINLTEKPGVYINIGGINWIGDNDRSLVRFAFGESFGKAGGVIRGVFVCAPDEAERILRSMLAFLDKPQS